MTQTTDPGVHPGPAAARLAPTILPAGGAQASWDTAQMSAARPAAKKKPRTGPIAAVPDPAPGPTAAAEPEPEVAEAATGASEPPASEAADSGTAESGTADSGTADSGSAASAPSAPGRPNAWAAPMNALGGFIRAQRQLAKLSLRDMATMTSVSNAYLSQVERGLHQPSLKVLHSIADALQLSTEQLLSQAGWATPAAAPAGAPAGGTEEAIRADPRLSPEQRTALLGVYRSFVDGSA